MSKKTKKAMSMLLVVTLIAVIAIGGMLAYLTDRDSEANVFTVGDVAIDLNEDFQQGAELIPGVDIKKEATITNTGDNDAWVWLTVLLPEEMGPYTAPDDMSASNNVVHWNYPKESAANITVDFNSTPVAVDTDGDGVTESYYQTNMLWKNVLKAGDTTDVMLSKVYMDTRVDIDPDGNMHWVVDGVATDLNWNVKEKGNPVIHVSAYAIQADTFADVEAAYKAYQTQWGDKGTEYENVATVKSLEELKNAVTNGGKYLIDTPIDVSENLTVAADTVLYGEAENMLTFKNNAKVTVNPDKSLELYGVQMDAEGDYSFDADGNITYDADARRTTPLLNASAGSKLVVGNGTVIENVVAKGSAVIQANGTEANRATVVIDGATIQNCAGESGTIINVAKAGDVVIEDGTVISNNASYNNNNHGIIRVYNAWDAANPSTVTMNGGVIEDNYYSGNGMIGLYYGKFIMNGGEIVSNSWFADNEVNNGWYPVIYAHSNSQFVMNGGEISDNVVKYGVINSLNSSVEGALTINGGTITNNIATNNNNEDALAVVIDKATNSLIVSENANVTGTVYLYYDEDGNVLRQFQDISEYFSK